MSNQEEELDAILSEYFTWRGEAIHEVSQTQNYRRMRRAIQDYTNEARIDELKEVQKVQITGHVAGVSKWYVADRLLELESAQLEQESKS